MDIVITAGGTKEAIDGVRSITNTSTGLTGALIAELLANRGHRITFVHAEDGMRPAPRESGPGSLALIPYTDFKSLDLALQRLLSERAFDAIVHSAAVSDFSVDRVLIDGRPTERSERMKLDSGSAMSIELKKNPKLLPLLKDYARNPTMKVIGFKLTVGATPQQRRDAVARVSTGTDYIVHNDLDEIGPHRHPATIYWRGEAIQQVETKMGLAAAIEDVLLREPLVAPKEMPL